MSYESFLAGKAPRPQAVGHEPGKLHRSLYPVGAFCRRGHRVIFSTGECYTMRELGPGLYEYVRGECEDIRALDGQLAACEEQARGER